MIHTNTLLMALRGLMRLIEQKVMGRPNGMPQISVTAKISSEMRNPSHRNKVTSQKDIA